MRLVCRSRGISPSASPSAKAAASFHRVARRPRLAAASETHRSLIRVQVRASGCRIRPSTMVSIRLPASSGRRGKTSGSSGSSCQRKSSSHRSAGWMRVAAGQHQRVAVLRKQAHRRQLLAGQRARQVVQQREGHVLDHLHRMLVDERWLGQQLLHRRLGGPQHAGRRRQADELEGARTLVQLGARGAQRGGVGGVEVTTPGGLGLLQVTPQRLLRRLQRTPEFGLHPGQRAQVVARHRFREGSHGGPFDRMDGTGAGAGSSPAVAPARPGRCGRG